MTVRRINHCRVPAGAGEGAGSAKAIRHLPVIYWLLFSAGGTCGPPVFV